MITNDEDRSSTIAVGGICSGFLPFLLLSNPNVAMLTGGKSPLFLFSLNLSMCSGDRLVGRILQLEVVVVSITWDIRDWSSGCELTERW